MFLGDLPSILRTHADRDAHRRALTFAPTYLGLERTDLTFGQLHQRSGATAAALRESLRPGDRALIVLPTIPEFAYAFLGCLEAGVIAVPLPLPADESSVRRVLSVARDSGARAVLCTSMIRELLAGQPLAEQLSAQVTWIDVDTIDVEATVTAPARTIAADDVAFLQYTSGSTKAPRGVVVTHGNLAHNETAIQSCFGVGAGSVIVSWLPLHHDMGLIGALLQPLYAGARAVILDPQSFLQRPASWLEEITAQGADISGGPNFAYELCARKVSEEERAGLDLSSWQVAFNGAAPVAPSSLATFSEAFRDVGFRPVAHTPCYGLAESTLLVASADAGAESVSRSFDVAALEQGRAVPAEQGRNLITYRLLDHARVRVVDPVSGRPVEDGRTGEIWVAGESNGHGYWGDPEGSAATFAATAPGSPEHHVRTGDLGFRLDCGLHVTGRLKDLVIYRGRNLHPEDLEADLTPGRPELRPGCGAVFAVADPDDSDERLVVGQEVRSGTSEELYPDLVRHIRHVLAQRYGVTAHTVALLPPGAILKTSSGKVQRFQAARRFGSGELPVLHLDQVVDRPDDTRSLAELVGAGLTGPEGAERLTRALRVHLGHRLGLREPVREDDRLTSLGVDSLLAVSLQHELEELLGVRLPPSLLLRAGSVAELARLATEFQPAAAPATANAGEYALTETQRALWFLQRTSRQSYAYNVTRAFTLTGPVDPERLAQALTAVVGAHETLRLIVGVRDGEPVGHIAAPGPVPLESVDARSWDEQQLRDRLTEDSTRPFDLATGPLIRVALLRRPVGHVLVLSLHHLVCDMFSLAIIIDQLVAAYAGRPPAPVTGGLRPADQERVELTERGEALSAYWAGELAGELPVLALPSSNHRRGWAGATVPFEAPPELSARLEELARQSGLTLHNLLLSTFQLLLHRITGQSDVIVGVPVAGRSDVRLTGYVGYLVNVLPIRSRLHAGRGFDDLAAATQARMLDALDHQDLPFPVLTRQLNPNRADGVPPIFQAMFSYYSSAMPGGRSVAGVLFGDEQATVELGEATLSGRPIPDHTAQSDIALNAALFGDRLRFGLQFDSTLLPRWQAEQCTAVFLALLDAVSAEPSADVSRLPLVDDAAAKELLDVGAGPHVARIEHYLTAFERQVAKDPEAVAVDDGTVRIGYAELNERANHVAAVLREAGVGTDTTVVVCAERSAAFLITLLGIHKAGGCYVPVSPGEAPRRAAEMLVTLRPAAIVAEGPGHDFLSRVTGQPPMRMSELTSGRRSATVPSRVSPDDSAYIIHTSGSTGVPKAAIVTAGGLTNHLWQMIEYFAIGAEDRIGQTGPASFDISVWQFLAGLLVGARTQVVDDGQSGSPARLKDAIVTGGTTILEVVPAVVGALLDEGLAEAPHALRTIIPTGEAVTWDVVRRWFRSCPQVRLYNAYGPAECADDVTIGLITEESDQTRSVSIGRPLANTTVHLLDDDLALVPKGVVGALHVGGLAVGRGYLSDPRRTAEVFLPDPFVGTPGARMYRTGDLARFAEDGELEFMGRADRQVKMRGLRIELGEVETALRECPDVTDAVAKIHRSAAGMALVAYLVRPQSPVGPSRQLGAGEYEPVRLALTELLPRHMIPTVFVEVGELPRLRTGKVDYNALDFTAETGGAEEWTPELLADPVVAAVRSSWAALLERDAIGRRDNFFLLGGHSLLALQMTDQVSRELAVDLEVDAIFANPGLNEFVEAVRQAPARASAPAVTIPRVPRRPATGA